MHGIIIANVLCIVGRAHEMPPVYSIGLFSCQDMRHCYNRKQAMKLTGNRATPLYTCIFSMFVVYGCTSVTTAYNSGSEGRRSTTGYNGGVTLTIAIH
jgi:hypothetical protein